MGEPFRAEIDLLSYQDEWSALTPRIAGPDAYRLADFRYSPALSGASLNIRKHPNGRNYIEVRSTRPVNEPYVYLLVEIDNKGTRIARGYSALLNPYGYGPQRAAPVEAYLPAVIPAVEYPKPSAGPAPVSASAFIPPPPRVQRAPVSAPAASSMADTRQLQRLEDQLTSSTKSLQDMLARVAVMEAQIQRLQRMLETAAAQPAPPAMQPPPVAATTSAPVAVIKPAVVAPATTPAQSVTPVVQAASASSELPPRRARGDSIVNEALLVLAGGSLLMLGWLVYWMSKRPKWKDGLPKPDDY